MHERVFHGAGAGDDLDVTELPGIGRVGGLLCWENRMPLARWRVYQGGPQIWLAPTADDSEGWLVSMRHIAIEAGAFVVSAPQYIPRSAFPADFPLDAPRRRPRCSGGAAPASCRPTGEVIAGPLYDGEGIVYADCDLREALHAKRYFDVAGHYSRADVLDPGGVAPWRTGSRSRSTAPAREPSARSGARCSATSSSRRRPASTPGRRRSTRWASTAPTPTAPSPSSTPRARARACSSSRSPRARRPRTASTST